MYKRTSSRMFHTLTLESTTVMEEEEPGIKHKDLCASGLMLQGDSVGRSNLGVTLVRLALLIRLTKAKWKSPCNFE